jgi:hypothetical protein
MKDEIGRAEIGKDAAQQAVDAGAKLVLEVTGAVVGSIRQITGSIGAFATELFEIRDAARRAHRESTEE